MRRLPIQPGLMFGRLTVLMESADKTPGGEIRYHCQCICGQQKTVTGSMLMSGNTKSCGCFRKENTGAMRRTHGQGFGENKTTEYRIWSGMKARCYIQSASGYKNYGGRGITVCKTWRDSFEAFFSDMGKRPIGQSLDRIDNHGPYSPENCRWATRLEQGRNSRRNRMLTNHGETLTLSQWAERLHITSGAILMRLKRGASIEEALHQPNSSQVQDQQGLKATR